MLSIPYQPDITLVAYGGSGLVYIVKDTIVLKCPVIYDVPEDVKDRDDYTLSTVHSYRAIDHEKSILRRIEPHHNLVQALATEHPEGIYLKKYQPLQTRMRENPAGRSRRILWYQDMARALAHLHDFNLAHTDFRLPNLLCDENDHVIICDLALVEEIGSDNQVATVAEDGTIDLNGLSKTLSDATDRFAFASVIYEMESGKLARMTMTSGNLQLPVIDTGHRCLDSIIERGWRCFYKTTSEMLRDIQILGVSLGSVDKRTASYMDLGKARSDVEQWRQSQEQAYGFIIKGLLSNDELICLRQEVNLSHAA